MEEKDKAVKNFLGEVEANPFEDNLKDPFLQETPQEEAVTENKVEKPLPFNKDPKVQKFIDKEIEKRLKDFKVEPTKEVTKVDDDYYVRLIGNDTPEKVAMIKESQARDERMLQQAEERAFNRLSQKEQEAVKAEKEAEAELENAFDNIEETYDVDISSTNPIAKKTRQDFVTFIERIAPKNSRGEIVDYPDMTSAWETFQEVQKATKQPSRAKELASRSMARSAETTVEQIKRPSWDSVDAFIESLGKKN